MSQSIARRSFLKSALAAGLGAGTLPRRIDAMASAALPPPYLREVASAYRSNPRRAALEWFAGARFGLFLHYGLYSLLGRHEWVQLRELIRVDEYAKLKDRFTAEKFDAGFIADLAVDAGMKYVNITTRHHDSFCLFDTAQTDFKSTASPARRDLVGELAEACSKRGLGLCLYYSHGRDWKHPHAPHNDDWKGAARPKYDPPEPTYKTGADHDLQVYVAFMKAQITELLTQYGPIAAIWLDGIGVPRTNEARLPEFRCQELYDHIHGLQPQVLVSYKQGMIGTEDFLAPERHWTEKPDKPLELCDTLQPKGWGYIAEDDGKHKTADDVMQMLATAAALPGNLLLNTGPLPDGAIHPEDVVTLREVGRRIKANGFPPPPAAGRDGGSDQ